MMGVHTSLHAPCHLQIQDGRLQTSPLLSPTRNNSNKEASKKKVAFDSQIRVQVIETNYDGADFWDIIDRTGKRVIPRTKQRRSGRRRKQKITVQRVLAQQAMEQRKTGSVSPDLLAGVSLTTSSIFAEEAHMAALHCALEVEEYLYSDDNTSESEGGEYFYDVLL